MGKRFLALLIVFAFTVTSFTLANAGEMDVLVNKLVEKGILSPHEAQILLAEAKEEAAKDLAKGKAVTAPAWTQRIKVKGDVRVRTQVDWGKNRAPAHQRTRNRVRARIGLEGKVNDQVKAGVKIVTGGTDARSTNQTLDNNFQTYDARLDQYYIKWTPKLDAKKIGKVNVWGGKFKNPFKKTDLLWDGDINPGGFAVQYMSPAFTDSVFPPTNIYGNGGFLWLDELGTSQYDAYMTVLQGGIKTEINADWGATLDLAGAWYGLSHVKGKSYSRLWSAGTNTLTTDDGTNVYAQGFSLIDIIAEYDAKKLFDLNLAHGIYSDFIWNTDVSDDDFAWKAGAYIGKKKPKKQGQWKLYGEYRYIERNAVPDFMPDSDFVGFLQNGTSSDGGTNGQGFVGGLKYALLKNTVLGLKYYYCKPIETASGGSNFEAPFNRFQMDVVVKF